MDVARELFERYRALLLLDLEDFVELRKLSVDVLGDGAEVGLKVEVFYFSSVNLLIIERIKLNTSSFLLSFKVVKKHGNVGQTSAIRLRQRFQLWFRQPVAFLELLRACGFFELV